MPRVRDHAPGDLFIENGYREHGYVLKLLASAHDQTVCIYAYSIDLRVSVKLLLHKAVIYGVKVCDG